MTVDAPRAGGALPIGTYLRGRIGGHPACASCTHIHRVTDSTNNIDVTYDTRCPECGCTANGAEYDRGIATVHDISDYRPDDDNNNLVAAFLAAEHDDDYSGPRCLPDVAGLRGGRNERQHAGLGLHPPVGEWGPLWDLLRGIWLRGCGLRRLVTSGPGRLCAEAVRAERLPLRGDVERPLHGGDGPEVTA